LIGVSTSLIIPFLAASLASERTGRTSCAAHDKAMYYASVVEREISVWSFEPQMIGHFANDRTYPVCDLAVAGSSIADCCFQSPA